jgi:hypothetical protein
MAGAESQHDEGAGVRKYFGLPVVVALEPGERVSRCLIPRTGSFSVQVVLANKCLLDLKRTGLVDGLLSPELGLGSDDGAQLAFACALGAGRCRFSGVVRGSFMRGSFGSGA